MFTTRFVYRFAKSVPVVDVTSFLAKKGDSSAQCAQVAEALHNYGAVCIKDPRVNDRHNVDFLDMMEKYFESRAAKFYNNETVEDIFPNYAYQVGATPEFVEKARTHNNVVRQYTKENEALTPQPAPYDAKWRFFWPIDDSGKRIKDEDFTPPRFRPKDVPQFGERMEQWGKMMINGCLTVAEMAAIGMSIPSDSFTSRMQNAPHLLAPTGSDLDRHKPGTIFAGFHYDLNFLTIHGKSRYPGLYVWLRNGERISVAVPEGHLLLQAGAQFDLLTGGYVTCGYHEVIYTEEARKKYEENKKAGKSTWRVSSTLFSHINSDVTLQPLDKFAKPGLPPKYKPIKAFDQVQQELEAIKLKL
ncbi:unnamed protein product [Paramecium sonneborni]|uniref:Uncharacterized protein n=1 Tax=Paramecium sonneborni TaxID=65129 RepID=A0A8S1PUL4_9CILI|nr:unnamed protein product [Paramecium sonneborni]